MSEKRPNNAPGGKSAGKKSGKSGAAPKPGGGDGPDQVDLFIEEVTEELQRERAYKMFRRYGPYVGGVVVAIVLAASVNEYLKSVETSEAREAGAALLTAGDTSNMELAAAAYAERASDLEGGAALLAQMHAGALRADTGDAEAAAEAFQSAASSAETDQPLYADLAILRATLARFDSAEPDRSIAALEPLSDEGRPFRPLALELLGLAEMKAGRTDQARVRLEEAFQAWEASPQARRRVSELLEGLGAASPDATAPADEETEPAENG